MRWMLALAALALTGCAAPESTTTTTTTPITTSPVATTTGPATTTAPATTTTPATTTSTPPVTATQPPATTTSPPPTTASVGIVGFAFDPATVRVATGGTVTWTNADPAAHTATGNAFDSGRLDEDESFPFTFTTPGTFEYRCAFHSSMRGTVVVG